MLFPLGPQDIAPVVHEFTMRHNRAGNRNVNESWLILGGDSILNKIEQEEDRWNNMRGRIDHNDVKGRTRDYITGGKDVTSCTEPELLSLSLSVRVCVKKSLNGGKF